jgi:hypothetical protein
MPFVSAVEPVSCKVVRRCHHGFRCQDAAFSRETLEPLARQIRIGHTCQGAATGIDRQLMVGTPAAHRAVGKDLMGLDDAFDAGGRSGGR